MAKKKISLFECQHCGEQSTKWLGKCPNCGSNYIIKKTNRNGIRRYKCNNCNKYCPQKEDQKD